MSGTRKFQLCRPPLANDNATPLYSFPIPLSLEHVSTNLDPSIFTLDGRRIINFRSAQLATSTLSQVDENLHTVKLCKRVRKLT